MISTVSFVNKLLWRIKCLEHKFTQYRLSTNETAVVDTEYGQVKGLKRKTLYDVPYYSFEGIPYAKPPVGELRFKAPEKPEPWKDVRDCSAMKNKATQLSMIFGTPEGSEDCLYLSVYTKNLNPSKPAPVMVWIHGGAFVAGEANREWFGPDYFMEKDVILVTVQYRLGAFGFLNLSSPELNVPGNAGLKDLILALKWVKNNISNFGGDPNCVTVFGESAGGALTHYLCLTEQTRGLFHRAILMSGTAYGYWANNGTKQYAFTLAQLAGYKGENNDKEVLEYLKKCKANDLVTLETKVMSAEKSPPHQLSFPFVPCIEQYDTPQCVLSKSPRDLMKTAWSNTIPIIVGSVSQEGLLVVPFLLLNPSLVNDVKTCENFVPEEIWDEKNVQRKAEKLRQIHANSGKILPEEFQDISAYSLFYFPQYCFMLSRLAYAPTASTYLYRYDFDSEVIAYPYRVWRHGNGVKGVGHGDELSYLFTHVLSYRLPKESPDYKNVVRMTGLWTKFAVSGNPNDNKIPGMEAINWQPVKDIESFYKCLNIGYELEFKDWPEMEKCKVWESLYDKKKELLY
ncbi:esterase B1-like [Eurosta solidaginis]|uniref:esterase B1-like n=1 Tax=Eurosta solidaginis TaxID=178769 RepID=UPI0035315E6F